MSPVVVPALHSEEGCRLMKQIISRLTFFQSFDAFPAARRDVSVFVFKGSKTTRQLLSNVIQSPANRRRHSNVFVCVVKSVHMGSNYSELGVFVCFSALMN